MSLMTVIRAPADDLTISRTAAFGLDLGVSTTSVIPRRRSRWRTRGSVGRLRSAVSRPRPPLSGSQGRSLSTSRPARGTSRSSAAVLALRVAVCLQAQQFLTRRLTRAVHLLLRKSSAPAVRRASSTRDRRGGQHDARSSGGRVPCCACDLDPSMRSSSRPDVRSGACAATMASASSPPRRCRGEAFRRHHYFQQLSFVALIVAIRMRACRAALADSAPRAS